MNINEDDLIIAGEEIAIEFGILENLSEEFSNTIGNIYYRYFHIIPDEIRNALDLINSEITSSNNALNTYDMDHSELMHHYCSFIQYAFPSTTGVFQQEASFLRAAKDKLPMISDFIWKQQNQLSELELNGINEIMLAVYKHRIENAMSKSIVRLKIEKRFRSQASCEIPGIIKMMEQASINRLGSKRIFDKLR